VKNSEQFPSRIHCSFQLHIVDQMHFLCSRPPIEHHRPIHLSTIYLLTNSKNCSTLQSPCCTSKGLFHHRLSLQRLQNHERRRIYVCRTQLVLQRCDAQSKCPAQYQPNVCRLSCHLLPVDMIGAQNRNDYTQQVEWDDRESDCRKFG
jgi:hypothetical protein